MKIVINRGHSHSNLSKKAVDMLVEKGFIICKREIKTGNFDINADIIDNREYSNSFNFMDRFMLNYHKEELRMDPRLIEVIEKLRIDASGVYSQLKVVEIPDNVKFEIIHIMIPEPEYIEEIKRIWY